MVGAAAIAGAFLILLAGRDMAITPEGADKKLEVYQTDEGLGVDLDKVSVCATLKLEQ